MGKMMTQVAIRQSGGANIISLPKVILRLLSIDKGQLLDISVEDEKIILTPVAEELSLESVLAGSPKESLVLLDEDLEWLHSTTGKEI